MLQCAIVTHFLFLDNIRDAVECVKTQVVKMSLNSDKISHNTR